MTSISIRPVKASGGYFEDDGFVPNSKLPFLYYPAGMIDFHGVSAQKAQHEIARIAQENGWYLDWVASVYQRTHYHSTAHEALIVFRGEAHLKLGGKNGRTLSFMPGNMIVIPAGVGHRRVSSTADFTVFGLYPDGQKWDLQWGFRKHHASSLRRIKKVPLPKADPILGRKGPLMSIWKK